MVLVRASKSARRSCVRTNSKNPPRPAGPAAGAAAQRVEVRAVVPAGLGEQRFDLPYHRFLEAGVVFAFAGMIDRLRQ